MGTRVYSSIGGRTHGIANPTFRESENRKLDSRVRPARMPKSGVI